MIESLMDASGQESRASRSGSGADPARPTDPPAAAAEAMVRTHWFAVRRFLRVLGAEPATADDLAQDAFVIALRKGVAAREPDAALGFLRATARHLFRAQRRRRRPVSVEHLEQVWEEQERDVDERRVLLQSCMGRLTDKVRRALSLAYGERRSRAEIAAALGIGPGGVKSLIRRAHQTLRECVERAMANERRQA